MVKKCPNGHFYNGDKYQDCPYCASAKTVSSKPTEDAGEEVVFASGKSEPVAEPKPAAVQTEPKAEQPAEVQTEPVTEQPAAVQTEPVTEQPAEVQTEPVTEQPAAVQTEPVAEQPAEVQTEQVTEQPAEVQTEPVTEQPAEVQTEQVTEQSAEVQTEQVTEQPAEVQTEPVTEQPADIQPESFFAPEKPVDIRSESLFASVNEPEPLPDISMGRIDNALPVYEPLANPAIAADTIPEYESVSESEAKEGGEKADDASGTDNTEDFDAGYVVGWLVCVGGAYYGESFELKSGNNTIGRSSTMNVVLEKDEAVTTESHAVLIYDAAAGSFSIQPGETVKIAYRNGEPVYKNEPLKAGDIVTVGSTKLLLFSLCNDKFSWNNF